MKLQPGKYIIQKGHGLTSKIEYWMVCRKNGQTVICIDSGLPFVAKPGDNEIYLDDDLKILKHLELTRKISMRKMHVEIHSIDEFGFSKVFKVVNAAAFNRVLTKFPGLEIVWKV
ncbi:hypothetical protein AAOE16_18195 [Ekhidna sp. MALMAid0563]|uniref:hypothetical protein n=1 Tax=Ekhidna sp. MALMAid0563 TaxID=3143937 RepID=UPI0032DF9E52